MEKRYYLDVAASASVTKGAQKAFMRALSAYGNPSAPHDEGRVASLVLENARLAIARSVGTKQDAVIFTSGATESNNIAIRGVIEHLHKNGRAYDTMRVLFQDGAHASTTNIMNVLSSNGVHTEVIPFKDGSLDLVWLESHIKPHTVLIALESIGSETGVRTNTKDIRRIIDRTSPQTLLHVDASQAPYVELINLEHFGADLLVCDAQKIGGVRGCGILVNSPRARLVPILFGGGQERGLRSGTPSPALASSFAHAFLQAQKERISFVSRATRSRTTLTNTLTTRIPKVYINEGKENAPHILNISLMGRDSDYLVALLNASGFALSTKSACESNNDEGSRGVFALTKDIERAECTLRISWGPQTKKEVLVRFANTLCAKVEFVDQHARAWYNADNGH